MLNRRSLSLSLISISLVPLAGCTTKPLRTVNVDGTYCYRFGRTYRRIRTCTPEPVPTDFVEAEAKRFEPDPKALTVYVIRRRWADTTEIVPITVDDRVRVATIPESLIRLRLKPGSHKLSFEWGGRSATTTAAGRDGDIRYVELNGSGWAWGTSFSWGVSAADVALPRAAASKLVADLDLRG
ncbi:MAG: hypothetical protein JNN03_23830 [Rubrivivax sp.]|nr:hypothetical protein [Rubrivivax sp.]